MPRFNKKFPIFRRSFIIRLVIVLFSPIILFVQTSLSQIVKPADLILEAEMLLAERGYWITKIDRKKDASTYHAVVASQKVEGRKITGVLTENELKAIRASSRPAPAYRGAAHIEVDISRQVLFLVNDRAIVTHILPVSTGSGEIYYQDGKRHTAYTPRGIFSIERQIKGVRRAPLGVLYHPNYFYKDVAIHGSNSIPFRPASHGCVRIPRFAAAEFSDLVRVGMKVAVYDNSMRAKIEKYTKDEIQNAPCKVKSEED